MVSSKVPLPKNEVARLDALRRYQILDTPPEKAFDDFTFLAAQICATPIALISLIDGNRQWFKSKVGLTVRETSRDVALCAYTILSQNLFVVRNALTDSRFVTNPLVTSNPNIRFYAGAPLLTPEKFAIGTLCVIDTEPRDLSPEQAEALLALSRQVSTQLELRLNVITLSNTITEQEQTAEKFRRQYDFIEAFYYEGVNKARRRDYLGAIEDFNQFLRLNPKGVKAYYDRGLARRQLKDYNGAMADFDQFLRFNPNDAEARRNRGLVRAQLGDYLGALADYNYTIRTNHDYGVGHYDQGLVRSEFGDNQELILNHTDSLQLNPNDVKADINLGDTSSEPEEHKEATEDYTDSLQLNPNDAKAYYKRALVRRRLGDYKGSIADLDQFLQSNPNDAEAHLNRGIARSEIGDYLGALADYSYAISANDDSTESPQLNSKDAKADISQSNAHEDVYVFKVSLGEVWRRIAIPANLELDWLSSSILQAFNFDNDQLYCFRFKDSFGRLIEVKHPYLEEPPFTSEVRIGELSLPVAASMSYLFDFVNNWLFDVQLEAIEPLNAIKKPKLLQTYGKAPKQYGRQRKNIIGIYEN